MLFFFERRREIIESEGFFGKIRGNRVSGLVSFQRSPWDFIFRHREVRLMPSIRAASWRFPLVFWRIFSMAIFSSSQRYRPEERRGSWAFPGLAFSSNSGRWDKVMMGPLTKTKACSTACSSSLIFPGHEYRWNNFRTFGSTPRTFFPYWELNLDTK